MRAEKKGIVSLFVAKGKTLRWEVVEQMGKTFYNREDLKNWRKNYGTVKSCFYKG